MVTGEVSHGDGMDMKTLCMSWDYLDGLGGGNLEWVNEENQRFSVINGWGKVWEKVPVDSALVPKARSWKARERCLGEASRDGRSCFFLARLHKLLHNRT